MISQSKVMKPHVYFESVRFTFSSIKFLDFGFFEYILRKTAWILPNCKKILFNFLRFLAHIEKIIHRISNGWWIWKPSLRFFFMSKFRLSPFENDQKTQTYLLTCRISIVWQFQKQIMDIYNHRNCKTICKE